MNHRIPPGVLSGRSDLFVNQEADHLLILAVMRWISSAGSLDDLIGLPVDDLMTIWLISR
jgi:hypothetical protein